MGDNIWNVNKQKEMFKNKNKEINKRDEFLINAIFVTPNFKIRTDRNKLF